MSGADGAARMRRRRLPDDRDSVADGVIHWQRAISRDKREMKREVPQKMRALRPSHRFWMTLKLHKGFPGSLNVCQNSDKYCSVGGGTVSLSSSEYAS
eukprot:2428798-Rhodomonas_salina.3